MNSSLFLPAMLAALNIQAILFAETSPYAEMPAKAKGGQMFRWKDVIPLLQELGDKKVKYDFTGVRKISRVPKPGVHPRIFFGPDDLPQVRSRLKTTRCGQSLEEHPLLDPRAQRHL